MLSPHLSSTNSTFYEDELSRSSGSHRLDKVVSESTPTPSIVGPSEAQQRHSQRTHDTHRTDSENPFFRPSPHPATTLPDTVTIGTNIAARRAHNAAQPISRLSADILEYLFLLGASLTHIPSYARSYVRPSSPTHHRDSPTRTILTYAQLTSSLRHTVLSSPRLWAHLINFEHASSRWTDELLRRSANVGLQLVFQWSKARGSFHSPHGIDDDALVPEGHRERRAKKTRMENMLRREVLERTRSIGIAVPPPYFADVLLRTLAGSGNSGGSRTLDRLKSLRIVRSQPRKIFGEEGRRDVEIDDEEANIPSGYVPFAILDAAPNLRELAIAETCLPFHDLLPYLSSSPPPPPIVASKSELSSLCLHPPSTDLSVRALNTLSRLRSLHIADLPLHLAPSAHEWLLYLCFTPALEELILEGAILSAADLGARAEERERLDGKTDTATNWREHEHIIAGEIKVSSDRLPTLRILTLNAALEDVGILAAALPLPPPSHDLLNNAIDPLQELREWTLRCANSRIEEAVGLTQVMNVLLRTANTTSGPAPGTPRDSSLSLSLTMPTTGHELHVEQRLSSPGLRFSAHLHLHVHNSVVAAPAPIRAARPAAMLVPAVLGYLQAVVLQRTTCLELDLPPLDDIAPLRRFLASAKHVARLSLGSQGSKSVLQLLRDTTNTRRASISACDVGAASDASLPVHADLTKCTEPVHGAVLLLPALKVLALSAEDCVGPVWTALIRCVKARKTRTPLVSVEFGSSNGHHSLLKAERVSDLRVLGVEVDIK